MEEPPRDLLKLTHIAQLLDIDLQSVASRARSRSSASSPEWDTLNCKPDVSVIRAPARCGF